MDDHIAESLNIQGHTVNILYDTDAMNPREEFDHLGTMVCFHSKYKMGDNHDYPDAESFFADITGLDTYENTDQEIQEKLSEMKEAGDIHMLPIYMYDHSGISISSKPFSCPWDSGQLGVIYVTRETLIKENLADKTAEEIQSYLDCEVAEYGHYAAGEVYGFQIEETGDSCFGFYGSDHEASGLLDHARASIEASEASQEETLSPGM
jgi:hypothetical protein